MAYRVIGQESSIQRGGFWVEKSYWNRNRVEWVIFTCLLVLVSFLFIIETRQVGLDLSIADVQSKETQNGYQILIGLKSTQPIDNEIRVRMIFEDGSEKEITWDLLQTRKEFALNTKVPLEEIILDIPKNIEDRNLQNNRYLAKLWSQGVKIISTDQLISYDWLRDSKGRIWLIGVGQKNVNSPKDLYLTVLSADGRKLITQQILSQSISEEVKPTIGEFEEKVYLFWANQSSDNMINQSSTQSTNLTHLHYEIYKEENGKVIKETESFLADKESKVSVVAAHLIQNQSPNVTLLIQTVREGMTGFSLYNLTDQGIKKLTDIREEDGEPIFFKGHTIEKLYCSTDSQGNYLLVWAERFHNRRDIYFSKVSKTGRELIPRKLIIKVNVGRRELAFNVLFAEDKVDLFYVRQYQDTMQVISEMVHQVVNTTGKVEEEAKMFKRGINKPFGQVTVVRNEREQFELVWMDKSNSEGPLQRDLVFGRFSETLVPAFKERRITANRAGQMKPDLKRISNHHWLTWQMYHHGKYHLYLQSTDSIFREGVTNALRWKNWTQLGLEFMVHLFFGTLAAIFVVIPFNLIPCLGLVVIALFFRSNYLRDRLLNWISAFLLVLICLIINLKYYSVFSFMSPPTNLVLALVTLGITLLTFILWRLFWKKEEGVIGNYCFLIGWLVLFTATYFACSLIQVM